MRLKKIEIDNFRPYKNVVIDLKKDEDRIIVLGSNDIGKTELLNAFYWCIWGELLTKKTSFPHFLNAFRTENKILGLFNSAAFSELKNNDFLKVFVRIVYFLNKNEVINPEIYPNGGDLIVERNLYVGKDENDDVEFYHCDKMDNVGRDDLVKINTGKLTDWPSNFFLRHPTKDSNLQLSEDPKKDIIGYFPNNNVTKFFMLDTTLLREYLMNSQDTNRANIDSVSDVKDINELIKNMESVNETIGKEKRKLQKDFDKNDSDYQANIELLEGLELNKADYDKNFAEEKIQEIRDGWNQDFNLKVEGKNIRPFNVSKIKRIHLLKLRLEYISELKNMTYDDISSIQEGKDLLETLGKLKNEKKDKERAIEDLTIDLSDSYVWWSIMIDSKAIRDDFIKNKIVLQYTPPPITREYLNQLLKERTCCCGSSLDPKLDRDRVMHIQGIMDNCVSKDTSTQISNISSRLTEMENVENKMLEKYDKYERDLGNLDEYRGKLNEVNNDIIKIDRQIINLGGEQAIKEKAKNKQLIENKKKTVKEIIEQELDINNQINTNQQQVQELEEAISKLKTKIRKVTMDDSKLDLLCEMDEFGNDVKKELDNLKDLFQKGLKENIRDDFYYEFKKLHWRDDYQVSIDDNLRIDLKDSMGNILTGDTSQGGSQMACIAFMKVLSKYSDLEMPLVLDTPYGNLDKEPRVNVTKRVLESNDQAFLICTTAELDTPKELFEVLFDKKYQKKTKTFMIERESNKYKQEFSLIKEIGIDKIKEEVKKEVKVKD